MKAIQNLVHTTKMVCSPRYATNYQVSTALTELQTEITRCHHQKANIALIRSLVQTVQSLDRQRLSEAIQLLVEASNFDCKAYAVELDPKQGKTCGDQLMENARGHLRLCGHGDRATWARKNLILARKWYRIARALTHDLAEEINAGLDRTKWVLSMWPNYAEIIDPESH